MIAYLETLRERLTDAVNPDELDVATRPAEPSGVERSLRPGDLRVDGRLLPSPTPDATIRFDPPVDAQAVCTALGIDEPVAVSPDVHQHTWWILVAGEELDDPHGRRIAAQRARVGRWEVVPVLSGRPAGDLPGVSSGASPAYDVRESGGSVAAIEIAPVRPVVQTRTDEADPGATVVDICDAGRAVAGATIADAGSGRAQAASFRFERELCGEGFGAALLDALEALARERGFARIRLDQSAFMLMFELPHERFGYTVGPPYDGDTDVEVWAEKEL